MIDPVSVEYVCDECSATRHGGVWFQVPFIYTPQCDNCDARSWSAEVIYL